MKSTKLNIMKTRPEISDAEIQSMMDFEKVLQLHTSAKRYRSIWMIVGSGMIIALIVGWAVVNPKEEKIIKTPEVIAPETKQPVAEPEQKSLQEEKKIAKKPAEVTTKPKEETSPSASTDIHVYVEAEPVNGYEDLYAYFEKELKYPAGVTSGVEGDVAVTFVINRKGKPGDVRFVNSLGSEFDQEVLRVINSMPPWKAAMQNGKPVPAKISQSFTFSIK